MRRGLGRYSMFGEPGQRSTVSTYKRSMSSAMRGRSGGVYVKTAKNANSL
jgi:hypothetical protein